MPGMSVEESIQAFSDAVVEQLPVGPVKAAVISRLPVVVMMAAVKGVVEDIVNELMGG